MPNWFEQNGFSQGQGMQQPPQMPEPPPPMQQSGSQLPYTPIFSKQGLKGLGAAALTGVRELVNIPHNVSGGVLPGAFQNVDIYKQFGVGKGIPEMITEEVVKFAPFSKAAQGIVRGGEAINAGIKLGAPALGKLADKTAKALEKLGGSKSLKTNLLSGTAYGAAMPGDQSVGMGALEGLGLALGAHGAGKVADKLVVQPIARAIARNAQPQLVKNAEKAIGSLGTPTTYANHLKQSHDIAKEFNAKNWAETESLAKNIDSKLGKTGGATVNPKPYNHFLDDYIREKNSLEPAKRHPYMNAIKFAEELKELAPKSFGGIVALRQNINEKLHSFMEKNNITRSDKNMDQLLSIAKDKIKEIFPSKFPTKEVAKEINNFKTKWEIANKSHKDLQEFYQGKHDILGDVGHQKSMREMLNSGEVDASIFSRYLPTSGEEGVRGMSQLGKVIGEPQAKNALRSYVGRDVEQGKNILNKYLDYSPEQRAAIFGGTKEGQDLALAANIKKKLGEGKGHAWGHWGLSTVGAGLPVFAASLLAGEPIEKALGYGALGSLGGHAAEKVAGKAITKAPKLLKKVIGVAENGRKKAGLGANYVAQSIGASLREKKEDQ